ncbi:MAG: Uma2 family endonuclease [Cyanobacteria bacterium J06621_3]
MKIPLRLALLLERSLMTYTQTRYKSYQDYLDDDSLSPEINHRLLSTGELIEVPPEDDDNTNVAFVLGFSIARLRKASFVNQVRTGTKEIQVRPVGDKRVNRKPDLLVLHPEHRDIAKQAILLGMVPPLFVAEVVSPGSENSDNYKRDYIWKRQQYQDWGIPEYWIIDRHRERVTVLVLTGDRYTEAVYAGSNPIESSVFPDLKVTAQTVLSGEV